MPSYSLLECDRYVFRGTDGLYYEVRSLPLNKRDLFALQWRRWKTMLGEARGLAAFIRKYDSRLSTGEANPDCDSEFRRLTDWLLQFLVAYDPLAATSIPLLSLVDAPTVVGLLVGHGNQPSIVEQLEFPDPSEGSETLPEGIDSTIHAKAAVSTYVGLDKAEALADTVPARELIATITEINRIQKSDRSLLATGKIRGLSKEDARTIQDECMAVFLQESKERSFADPLACIQ